MTKEFTMLKKTFFNYKIKIKTTTTTGLKKKLEYSPMSEGNICIAEPNLEALPLRKIQQRTSLVFFRKFLKIMYGVMTLIKCNCFTIR